MVFSCVSGHVVSSGYDKRVAELAMKSRLPSISNPTRWAEAGGLMSYGADFRH